MNKHHMIFITNLLHVKFVMDVNHYFTQHPKLPQGQSQTSNASKSQGYRKKAKKQLIWGRLLN
jgi:hypothetical protein